MPSRAYCGKSGTNTGAKFVWVTVMFTVSVLLMLPSPAVTCTVVAAGLAGLRRPGQQPESPGRAWRRLGRFCAV